MVKEITIESQAFVTRHRKNGVAESSYELQFRIYLKVSLSLSFKNLIREDSYLYYATPKKQKF
jgi:hypothetical protein